MIQTIIQVCCIIIVMQVKEQAPCQIPVRGIRVPKVKLPELERTENGQLVMSLSNLKIICEIDGLYQFPQMNTKIYLHFKVISKIASLEPYVNLKTVYLQNNVIRKIQGLSSLGQLINLFLQNNMIKKIQGLSTLKNLRVLNLANNQIFKLQGLEELGQLQIVTLAKNYLSNFDSIEHLGHCSSTLTNIDLSDNQITPDQRLFQLIQQVKILYLYGNPLIKETVHYRRTVVGRLPALMYLDQRGIDSQERIMAQAWVEQGQAGFRKAREKVLQLRKEKSLSRKQEIMKDIDVHRRNKINIFTKNILEAEENIIKLRGYMGEPGNETNHFFYQKSIEQAIHKIRDNQTFIDSLYRRLGRQPEPPIATIDLTLVQEEPERPQQQREQGLEQVDQASEREETQSQNSEPSQASRQGRQSQTSQPSESNSSQQESLKTYNSLQQLD